MTLDQIANALRSEVDLIPKNTPSNTAQAERLVKLAKELDQARNVVKRTRACLAMLARELDRLEGNP